MSGCRCNSSLINDEKFENVLNIFKYRSISGVVRSKSCEDFYCGEPQKDRGPPVMAAAMKLFTVHFLTLSNNPLR